MPDMPSPTAHRLKGFTADLFAERRVVVTGAGRGIGRATALAFAGHGARLWLIDRDADALEEVATAIAHHGSAPTRWPCDLSDATQREDLVQRLAAMGSLDVLLNNAGVFLREEDPTRWPAHGWRTTLAVNLDAVAQLSFACVDGLRARAGSIVNIASSRAFTAAAGASAYTASKAAVVGLTHSLAVDLAPLGIRVNAVAPGEVATGMGGDDPAILSSLVARSPMGRRADPQEIAAVILFLASPMASFVTGATWRVDGGFLSA